MPNGFFGPIRFKTEKVNIIIEFCINQISLGNKFHFKQTVFNCGTKFSQKGRVWLKTEKVNINIEFCILELV